MAIAASLLFLLICSFTIWNSAQLGVLTYPLDDAYIGMAMAKNLSQHGVWGVSGEFASAASSPGFILLLSACYLITGPNVYWPLILATLGAIGALLAGAWILRNAPPTVQIAGMVGLALLTPLHVTAALGMEHSLHIAFSLLFIGIALPVISERRPLTLALLAAAALMVSFRYEGLFVAAGACLLLVMQGRWRSSLILAAAAWLPVFAFGVYFRTHGGGWVPNSLLLKGGPAISKLFDFLGEGLYAAPLICVITSAMGKRWRPPHSTAAAALGITTVAFCLHLVLARFGWVYRYEAYLIAMGVASLALLMAERPRMTAGVSVALGCLMAHAAIATITIPGRCGVFYRQQYQTSRILKEYGQTAAINDLGAPAYYTDLHIVDLVGLGTQEISNCRYSRPYTTAVLSDICRRRGVKVIAIYDDWFKNGPRIPWGGPALPMDWPLVAKLHAPDPHRYAAEDTVSFYAAPGTETALRAAIKRIQPSLPAESSLLIQ